MDSPSPNSALPLHKIIWVFEYEGEEVAPIHSMELIQDYGRPWAGNIEFSMLQGAMSDSFDMDVWATICWSAEVEVDEMTIKGKINEQES